MNTSKQSVLKFTTDLGEPVMSVLSYLIMYFFNVVPLQALSVLSAPICCDLFPIGSVSIDCGGGNSANLFCPVESVP